MSRVSRDPYDVLGIPRDADEATIKTAFRKLALKFHPDRNPGDEAAEERFKEASEAYAVLRDPTTRSQYDRFGQAGVPTAAGGSFRPDFRGMDWSTIFAEANIPMSRGPTRGGTGHPMFDALFGAMSMFMTGGALLAGQTYDAEVSVTLAELVTGATKQVRVPGPTTCPACGGQGGSCPSCNGRGVVRHRVYTQVEIPAGTRFDGMVQVPGAGGPGRPPGDLRVHLRVVLPDTAEIIGNDVHDTIYVSDIDRLFGVKSSYSGVEVRIPKGAKPGQTLRIRGAGLSGGNLVLQLAKHTGRGLLRLGHDVVSNVSTAIRKGTKQ